MAKSNRNTRRTVNETAEGSASNVARNEAGTEEARNAAQNAANLNNAAAAGAAAVAAAAPVGLEAVLALLAQALARLPTAAAPPVAPPVAEEVENVVPDGEEAPVVRNPSYLKHAGKNQKPVKAGSSSKPNATGSSACSTCGKMHSGVCRAATGACHHCGSMDHKVRDCPEEDLRPKSHNKGAGERVCYNCGETGHYKNQCLKDAQSAGKRPSDGPQPAAKRQAIMPRVYTIGDDSMDPSTSRPITVRVKNDRLWGESDCLNVRRSDGNRSRGVRRDRIKQNKPTLRQRSGPDPKG
ncbi:hypothetical protein F2Q70_00042925 [Brassica cretica]|uniref:CCHC-type domain-containing protein n=1 Tax=Brassica cretica TaxID=69181 RepID=A0A8S9KF40_BRACR|nr:hypothetical protein F2Q70_00042925 [Brassica cretica]